MFDEYKNRKTKIKNKPPNKFGIYHYPPIRTILVNGHQSCYQMRIKVFSEIMSFLNIYKNIFFDVDY